MEMFLRRKFRHKEIGWEAIGERFTRYAILKTRWFSIYLHQLYAPRWHPACHDHPWGFVTLILKRGYLEQIGTKKFERHAGAILYRPATFAHNVITPHGTSWSLIVAGPKSREWGFKPCDHEGPSVSYTKYIQENQNVQTV